MYVLGLDIGTSSMKGVLMRNNGDIVSVKQETYPVIVREGGVVEQDPADWLKACDKLIFAFIEAVSDFRENLEAISFSGQMHSLILLDAQNKPLRNAILWSDTRTSRQCQEVLRRFPNLLEVTHNTALEGFTLPKILWVQENEPACWDKVQKIVLPKDYVRYYLDGNIYMDLSDAAGTLLLDIKKKEWSTALCNCFDIPQELLPNLVKSTAITGVLNEGLRRKYGFLREIQIVAGGADNPCAALASGITDPSEILISIGTSGVVLSPRESLAVSPGGIVHEFLGVNGTPYTMGVTLSAGNSLKWFREVFARTTSFEELMSEASLVEIGSGGLFFTPYLVGERTPYPDSRIRGSFVGIDITHGRANFSRAVIEGVTFSLKDCFELVSKDKVGTVKKLISVGGGSKSSLWLQMQADIFGLPVCSLVNEEGPGQGAAMLAAIGIGWYDSYEECINYVVKRTADYNPNLDNVGQYQSLYDIYRSIYGATKSLR